MNDRSAEVDRRELFRTAVRGLAFGALAAGAWLLALRNGSDECRLTNPCTSCRLRDDCHLDRREDARRTER